MNTMEKKWELPHLFSAFETNKQGSQSQLLSEAFIKRSDLYWYNTNLSEVMTLIDRSRVNFYGHNKTEEFQWTKSYFFLKKEILISLIF